MTRTSKRTRFLSTAERRTRNVLKRIKCLGRCASRYYDYSDSDVEAIFGAIQREVDRAAARFGRESEPFSLTRSPR